MAKITIVKLIRDEDTGKLQIYLDGESTDCISCMMDGTLEVFERNRKQVTKNKFEEIVLRYLSFMKEGLYAIMDTEKDKK